MSRIFISDDQWIERDDSATPGWRYYDGVHRGFCGATTFALVATEEEMARAEVEARDLCRQRREYARR